MSTEEMQQQFEAWWDGRGLPEKMKAPFYMAWKASRAALVVEMPPMEKKQRDNIEATFSAGANWMRLRCLSALESAGIPVKP